MTDQMQGLRDDIAFLRELTQDSGQGLAREGVLMLTLGAIFGVVNFIYWLLYAGLLRGAGPIGDWLWIAGLVAFFVITPILRARLPSGNGVGSRAMSAAMGGIGVALTAACAGVLVSGLRLGNPNLVLWFFPVVLFTLYGSAWGVAFAVKRQGGFAVVAAGCFLTAVVAGALWATPHEWLALSVGLVAWVGVPGLVILRRGRAV